MTIRSAILALAPTVYWPMDDPNGPAASDASGNSHPGFYLASTSQGADGPEVGTKCASTAAKRGGVQIISTNPLSGTGPFTLGVWIALAQPSDPSEVLVYTGISNLNGCGLLISVGSLQILRGGLEQVDLGVQVSGGVWHHIAHSFTTSGNRLTILDGVQVDSHPAGVPNSVGTGDPLLAQTPAPALIAHAAFWTSALTLAQIQTIWNAGPGAGHAANTSQAGLPVAGVQLTDTAKLDAILASVRKTY